MVRWNTSDRMVAAAIVLVASSCSRDAAPTTPESHTSKASTYDRLEQRVPPIVVAVKQLDDVVSNTTDCRTIAAALRDFGTAHAAELDDIATMKASLAPADRDKFEETYFQTGLRIRSMVMHVVELCNDDEAVAALDVSRLKLNMNKPPSPDTRHGVLSR